MANGKTNKLVGLFLAAALTVSSGCAADDEAFYEDECLDENNDGYCDDDGSPTGGTYVDIDGKKKYKRLYTGVTKGAKGGIGSSGYSSSG